MAQISDEISAKVAAMLFEQIIRGVDYGIDISKDMVYFAGAEIHSSAEALKKLGEEIRKKIGDKEFEKLLNDSGEIGLGQMDELIERCHVKSGTIKILDEDVERFEKLINQDGVLYAKINMKEDNCRMFVYLDSEVEKIQKAARIISAEKGFVTELPPDLFMQTDNISSLREITGVDNVELELFRHYAKQKNNFMFTVLPISKDNNTLIINTTDQKSANAAQRTMTEVGWALTGRNGARVREQIEHKIAGRTAILKSIDDAQKELFIVSKNNPDQFVRITAEDFQIYKANNLLKKVDKSQMSHEDFREECFRACESVPHAVIITPEEFSMGISPQILADRPTMDLFDNNFDEAIENNMMNEMVRLVQTGIKDKERQYRDNARIQRAGEKMALDDEGNSGISAWDESVSYSEFSQYEEIADDDEIEAREYQFEHFKNAAFYSDRNFETHNHNVDKNIDVIIERAEQQRRIREEAAAKVRDSINKQTAEKEESHDI